MKKKAIICVHHIRYRYPGQATDALKDISFGIPSGDFVAIIGPNGSGKTTIIKLILGILKPQEGRIHILGIPVREFRNWSKIGYVPQKLATPDPNFPANVYEIVRMGLISRPTRHHEEKHLIDDALKRVNMQEFIHKKISELSGGQQQRILIARSLVAEPDILILDEPTAEVDIRAQRDFYTLLKALNKTGITIVLVTHDIGILTKHVKTVICVNKELLCLGPPGKTIEKIEHVFGKEHMLEHTH